MFYTRAYKARFQTRAHVQDDDRRTREFSLQCCGSLVQTHSVNIVVSGYYREEKKSSNIPSRHRAIDRIL